MRDRKLARSPSDLLCSHSIAVWLQGRTEMAVMIPGYAILIYGSY